MSQLTSNARISDIISSLGASEGINQKVELSAIIGSPTLPTDDIPTQINNLDTIRDSLVSLTNDALSNQTTVKGNLVTSLNNKIGTNLSNTNSWTEIINTIPLANAKRVATGTITSGTVLSAYSYESSSTGNMYTVNVTGLNFKPSYIYCITSTGADITIYSSSISDGFYTPNVRTISGYTNNTTTIATIKSFKGDISPVSVVNGSFSLPVYTSNAIYAYIAIE